jgi:hypothetical protein
MPAAGMVYRLYLCAVRPLDRHRHPQLRMIRPAIAINRRKDVICRVCLRWEASHRAPCTHHNLLEEIYLMGVVARSRTARCRRKLILIVGYISAWWHMHPGWPLDESFSMHCLLADDRYCRNWHAWSEDYIPGYVSTWPPQRSARCKNGKCDQV